MTGQPEPRVRNKPEEVAAQAVGAVGAVHNRPAVGVARNTPAEAGEVAHNKPVGAEEAVHNNSAGAMVRNIPVDQQSRTRNLGRYPNRHAQCRSYPERWPL